MLVKDYMTRHPIMIEAHRAVMDAQKIMVESKIRHLPVVGEGKRLVGLITRQRLSIPPDRLGSLDVWEITRFLTNLTVDKVMVKGKDLHTISPQATLEEAAALMIQHKVGSLPVIEDDVVVGIITDSDLLVELQNLLGANDAGWRVTIRIPDRRGEYSKLTRAMTDHSWGIMALGSVRSPKAPGHWDMVLKVRGCGKEELQAILEAIPDQELVDLRETKSYEESG